jgi:uncharacterized membrane protein
MALEPHVLVVIVLMAAATYVTRAGGFWLMRWVRLTPRVEAWIRHLPGAVLVSMVVPAALTRGAAETLAVAVTAGVMALSRNELAAMAAGIGCVAAGRYILVGL